MRNFYLTFIILVTAFSGKVMAQAPASFNYQAVARDSSGNFLANQTRVVTITLNDNANYTYTETHNVTTNSHGLFSLAIGSKSGTLASTGTFQNLNWAGGNVNVTVKFGETVIGTSQLLSVPYALYSNSARTALNGGSNVKIKGSNGIKIDSANGTYTVRFSVDSSRYQQGGGLAGRPIDTTQNTTGLNNNEILVYDGSKWVNKTLTKTYWDTTNNGGISYNKGKVIIGGNSVGNYNFEVRGGTALGGLYVGGNTTIDQQLDLRSFKFRDTDFSKRGEGKVLTSLDTAGNVGWRSITGASGWELHGNTPESLSDTSFIGTKGNNSLRFRTNNLQRMIVDSETGNVSVGGKPTKSKFAVYGGLSIDAGDVHDKPYSINKFVGNNAVLTFGHDSSGEGIGSLRKDVIGNTYDNHRGLDFYTNFEARLTIRQHGNVGIGTTEPSSKFQVFAGVGKDVADGTSAGKFGSNDKKQTVLEISNGDQGPSSETIYRLCTTGKNNPVLSTKAFGINYGTTDNYRFVIDSAGQVGVGTNKPLSKLHIQGGLRIDSLAGSRTNMYLIVHPNGVVGKIATPGNINSPGSLPFPGTDGIISTSNNIPLSFRTANLERMSIATDGQVVIEENLAVNGKVQASSVTETSDRRYKKDILPISNSLETIQKLTGVSYTWRSKEFPSMNFDKGTDIGLIAQEVEKVLPELVNTDSNGYKSVEYSHLVALLIEGIKEQQKQIENLKNELSASVKDKETSNSRIQNLESSMKTMSSQMHLLLELTGNKEGVKASK